VQWSRATHRRRRHPKAWTLLTALDQIKGHEEQFGRTRHQDRVYSRDFRGPNWLDQRKASGEYADRDPAVLVVGGGQAGLSIAARLTQLQVDTLIVDRWPRIGDNWRRRYHALVLHNQTHQSPAVHAVPADVAELHPEGQGRELVRGVCREPGSQLLGGHGIRGRILRREPTPLDGHAPPCRRNDEAVTPAPCGHGDRASGIPVVPDIPTLKNFGGTVIHSSQYEDGEAWTGKSALVIGTGNSRQDIGQDLHSAGAKTTLVQRGSTIVVQVEPSAQLPYALYDEGPPLEDCDLITVSVPLALAKKSHIALTEQAKKLDQSLLDGLTQRGFRLDFGDDGAGWQFKYLTRGGGYYFNVGCSDLIVKDEVGLIQFSDIAEFVTNGAKLHNGNILETDLIVLATGYQGQEALVRKLFGDSVAARVGPIWGFGNGQELRNMLCVHRSLGSGSSRAASRSAGSIRSILRCKSGHRGGSAVYHYRRLTRLIAERPPSPWRRRVSFRYSLRRRRGTRRPRSWSGRRRRSRTRR
jgi:hypothetical protein